MCYSLRIKVLNSSNEAFEKGPADFWLESALLPEVLEKFSSLCELEDENGSIFERLACHLELSVLLGVDHVDEVGVAELGQEIGFDLVGGFLAGARKVHFEGVQLILLAAKIHAD